MSREGSNPETTSIETQISGPEVPDMAELFCSYIEAEKDEIRAISIELELGPKPVENQDENPEESGQERDETDEEADKGDGTEDTNNSQEHAQTDDKGLSAIFDRDSVNADATPKEQAGSSEFDMDEIVTLDPNGRTRKVLEQMWGMQWTDSAEIAESMGPEYTSNKISQIIHAAENNHEPLTIERRNHPDDPSGRRNQYHITKAGIKAVKKARKRAQEPEAQ